MAGLLTPKYVVALDLETTELVDFKNLSAAKVSVVVALRSADDGTVLDASVVLRDRATDALPPADLEAFGVMCDDADMLIAHHGIGFDLKVLAGVFSVDRVAAWGAKMLDTCVVTRRVSLKALLACNDLGGKLGDGCDAPGLWQDGRIDELVAYCRRDVEALCDLWGLRRIKSPKSDFPLDLDLSADVVLKCL
jgi:hypothetical protein